MLVKLVYYRIHDMSWKDSRIDCCSISKWYSNYIDMDDICRISIYSSVAFQLVHLCNMHSSHLLHTKFPRAWVSHIWVTCCTVIAFSMISEKCKLIIEIKKTKITFYVLDSILVITTEASCFHNTFVQYSQISPNIPMLLTNCAHTHTQIL